MKRSFKKKNVRKASWLTKYTPHPVAINRQAPGLGRSLKTRLETTFFVTATTNAAGLWTGSLKPGSCFDPTGSLALIQPVGFDQLKLLYARYLVTGGHVEIEVAVATADAILPYAFAAYPSTLAAVAATFQGAGSQPYAKEFLVAPGSSKKFIIPFNTQHIVGSRLPVVAEDCGALVTADPATGQYVNMPLYLQSGVAAAQTAVCLRFRIVQDVIFDQRIQVEDV